MFVMQCILIFPKNMATWNFRDFVGKRLLVLNYPFKVEMLKELQNGDELFVTDGAANLLIGLVALETKVVIIGDMDSISKDAREHFEAHPKAEMIIIKDQESTDFTKALNYMFKDEDFGDVYVLGGLDGRFDHTMSSINTLELFKQSNIYLFNEESVVVLLKKGQNRIESTSGNICGFFPIHGPTRVKTKGLRWDIDGLITFGGLISSSNCVVDYPVWIECDQPIIYSNSYKNKV